MAYIQNNNQDQLDNTDQSGSNSQAQSGSSSTGNPVNISGSAATSSGGNSATSTAPAYSPSATKSGSYNNVQNYINANAGYKQDQGGLAGQTYQNLKDQQQQQENSIGQADQQFQNQSSQAASSYDPSKVSNFVNQTLADPTKASQNDITQYQNYLNAQYNGPTNLQNASDLQNQTNQYAQTTNLTASEPGRMALLQKLYGGAGNYSTGQQTLDNLLLQTNPSQLQQLQSAQGLGSQVQTDLSNTINNDQLAAQKYQNNALAAKNLSTSSLVNSASQLDQSLQDRANQNAQAQKTAYDRINNELQSGTISSDDLSLLGLSPTQVSNLYGVKVGDYLNQELTPTKQNVATTSDVSKLQALANLGGTYLPNVGVTAQQYTGDPSQVGTYDPNKAVGLNLSNFTNALSSAQNNFNSDYKTGYVDAANTNHPDLVKGTEVTSTGNPVQDIAALQNDLSTRAQGNPTTQQQDQTAIAALQNLIGKYGYGQGLNIQTNKLPSGIGGGVLQ